jgi:hypothetical protein
VYYNTWKSQGQGGRSSLVDEVGAQLIESAIEGEGRKTGFDELFEWPLAPHRRSNPDIRKSYTYQENKKGGIGFPPLRKP